MSAFISVEFAFSLPKTVLLNSMTATWKPKHTPKYGFLDSRAYLQFGEGHTPGSHQSTNGQLKRLRDRQMKSELDLHPTPTDVCAACAIFGWAEEIG